MVANELVPAAAMLVRLFDAIKPELLTREVLYGYPSPLQRALLWGVQAVHETEHHRGDIEENPGG